MTFKKLALSATLLVGLGAAVFLMQSAEAEPIKVASEASFPPFSQTEADGSVTGFEIDLGNAVCEAAGLECEWIAQDFDGIMAGLLSEKYRFIFSSMSITAERMEVVDFSIPYYDTPSAFFGAAGMDGDTSAAALNGKIVGTYAGSTQESYLSATYGDAIEIRGYENLDQATADLNAGRIDLVFVEQLAASEVVNGEGGSELAFVGEPVRDPDLLGMGVGAVFRKGDDELREQINDALREVYANGTFDEIAARYFDVSVRADAYW